MKWHIPPENQGQIVEISYADNFDGDGFLYKRVLDKSDRTVKYYIADYLDCGCADECNCFEPWNVEPTKYTWHRTTKPLPLED